jgi:hypothetical protein
MKVKKTDGSDTILEINELSKWFPITNAWNRKTGESDFNIPIKTLAHRWILVGK